MTQKVVITAAAGGIGKAIAQAFLAAGALVHICDIDEDALVEFAGSHENLTGGVCDVADGEAVKAFVADAADALDGIDVLVNNAGIAGPTAPVAELSITDWQGVLDVNLTGTLMVTQAALPHLLESEHGSVICMSSLGGRFGYENRAPYAVTKRGIIAFVETLALEVGPKGVRANAIAPGAVDGARIRRVMVERAKRTGITVDKQEAQAMAIQSVKRFVDPADVGQLAVFLASEGARSINGQTIAIDGGSQQAS